MDVLFNIKRVKSLMQTNPAAAAAKIKEYIEQLNNVPLNIAITGESGSGKSTFVNHFRGMTNDDEGAAPTGVTETTLDTKSYPHPKYPNVILSDLPGVGTPKFPADKYLKLVGFEKFDFFIIISATRFRENDVKLAKEIQKLEKKFYFVRSKIDDDLQAEERSKKNFNAEETKEKVRKDCIQGLQNEGFESPKVFLLSSFDLHLHDFPLLHETFDRELPEHKRHVLLMAMPNINLELINKKKKALEAQIKFYAAVSALGSAFHVTELSVLGDLSLMLKAVKQYVVSFRLDIQSLQNLAENTEIPVADLKHVIKSPLAAAEITPALIKECLGQLEGRGIALMSQDEADRFIPINGIPAAMRCSYKNTYKALSHFLNMLTEDAQSVFNKALGLNSSG